MQIWRFKSGVDVYGKTRESHTDYLSGVRSLYRIEFCCLEAGRDAYELYLGVICGALGRPNMACLRD